MTEEQKLASQVWAQLAAGIAARCEYIKDVPSKTDKLFEEWKQRFKD